jgi:hypothetical protein
MRKRAGARPGQNNAAPLFPLWSGWFRPSLIMAAPLKVRPFFPNPPGRQVMERNFDDIADTIGRRVATVFIVLLYALFAYGYLRPLF